MLGLQVHIAVPDFLCVNVYVCVVDYRPFTVSVSGKKSKILRMELVEA